MLNKEVQIKLYSKAGTFITTLQDTYISSSVSFDMQINSGVGRLSFNYHNDYAFNITDVIQVNDGQGRIIYRGWISNKKTSITSTGSIQTIEAQGMQTLLNSLYFPDGTVADDPKNILEDILDVYNATAFRDWTYDIDTYGSSISVDFTNDTLLSAINKVIQNQGNYLYFDIGTVYYKPYETGTHHLVNLGNEVNAIDIDYNGQNIQNDLTIEYDGGTTTVADSTSISLHGTYKKYIKDTSIKNLATATERGNAILQQYAYPKEKTKVILNREYDIESIKPGQTISILNTNESVKNKTIQRIRYNIQGVELEIDEFDTIEKSVKKSLSS